MTTEQRIIKLAAEAFGVKESEVSGTSTWDHLNADSLDVIDFLFVVEDDFNIEIDDTIYEKFTCLQDIINHIEGGK